MERGSPPFPPWVFDANIQNQFLIWKKNLKKNQHVAEHGMGQDVRKYVQNTMDLLLRF